MKNFVLVLIFILFSGQVFGQKLVSKNLQRFDHRKIHFGFSLGLNSGGFALQREPITTASDSLVSLEVLSQGGFSLGIVSDYHLHPYFNIRFLPTLVFGQRNLEYSFVTKNGLIRLIEVPVESTYLDFPILFKYRSARLNNFAAYFIGGIKYSVDLSSDEDVNNDEIDEPIVKLKRNTSAVEVGIGTDFFLPYFKFAIELKMSFGLQDALIKDNTELSDPVEKIVPKMFFISFLFEG